MKHANFIVFEGIDGSGKSTQSILLYSRLIEDKIPCYLTQEPTNFIEDFIRNLFKSDFMDKDVAPSTLAYLFAADRHQHLYKEDGIIDKLASGQTVICDRYLYSSIAYQFNKQKQAKTTEHIQASALVRRLNDDFPSPDVIFYFDIAVNDALSRMAVKEKDQMEKLDTLRRVKENYEKLFFDTNSELSHKVLRIDASAGRETIRNIIYSRISELFTH